MGTDSAIYKRSLGDVNIIIKNAKLDARNLTPITQAIYYPSAEAFEDNLKLLELDEHMLKEIRKGQILQFKGGLNEKVVLCTEEKTYDVKAAEISNSLLIVPDLKFAAETTTSPLKSPRNSQNSSMERSSNDSFEDDFPIERVVEHRKVLKVCHEYFECREIRPRYRKLGELLQITRYSGPEHEDCIDRKFLFTYDQLLDTIQCSRKQFEIGLHHYRAIKFNGWMRVLECDYEYRIINLMVGLINENSWDLNQVDREETLTALEGIAPKEIVAGLFDLYAEATDTYFKKFCYKEDLVARIVAQNILQPGLKFRVEEFFNSWQEALPDGMKCDEKYLRGLGIFDKQGQTSCIRSLVEENLPIAIHDRMKLLFKTKSRWTLNEIEPYIEYYTTPIMSVSMILAKYARSVTVNGLRFYVSKH